MHTEAFVLEAPDVETRYQSDYEIERNKPMPNFAHGLIQSKINLLLSLANGDDYVFPNELSLATTPPSTPDICIYPKVKVDVWTLEAKESSVPLTTIEIISPSQSVHELMQKARDLFFPFGVKSAWLVIPEFKAIRILLPSGQQFNFEKGMVSDPTNGIQIPVERVFEDLV